MKSIAQKIFKFFLICAYIAPFVIWFYLGFTGGLGAEPVVKINSQSGYVTLILILLNLWLGALISMRVRWLQKIKWLLQERRSLGITTGLYVAFHFSSYLGKESFLPKAWEQLIAKTYLTFGLSAAVIIWLLTMTSNQFSVRKLTMKNWKRLHRLVYLASVAILFHVFSIEKGNIPLLLVLIIPLVPFQLFRLFKQLKLGWKN